MIDPEKVQAALAVLHEIVTELLAEREILQEALILARDDLEAHGLQAGVKP